jgi:thiol-disulfide isomerase/thioredoxin
MRANCWPFPKPFRAPLCVVSFAMALEVASLSVAHGQGNTASPTSALHGGGFFGGQDLDFWSEGKRVPLFLPSSEASKGSTASAEAPMPPSGSLIRQRDAKPFDWSRYQDPKNPEFWDDGGDYVAPRPLRESVAHPTPENIEAYLAWQAKRLEVVATFDAKLAEHALATLGASPSPRVIETEKEPIHKMTADAVRWNEVDLLYFYQSTCPHCQAEKEHVEDLARRGVRVVFIQMDAGDNPPLHAGSVPYTAAHSRQFAITATPTWIFRRRKASVRLQGAQSEGELTNHISTLFPSSGEALRHSHNERNK